MDKITILLQDRQTIEKLASDPEVQLKIKNAIIDGVAKRQLKLLGVTNEILLAQKNQINDMFLEKRGYSKLLRKEFVAIVDDQCRKAFDKLVEEEVRLYYAEIKNTIRKWKAQIYLDLRNYNFDTAIRDVIEMVVRKKFKE